MFGIQPTPYDLQFTLFRIPVRVHPLFWLMGLAMGWMPDYPRLMFIWVLCLFVSILIHELGHAVTAEWFGWRSHVLLYHFGGLAFFEPDYRVSQPRLIAVALAGPGAGFLFYGLILAGVAGLRVADIPLRDLSPEVRFTIYNLEWINLWWGLVNLLPVYPLDGGRVCQSLLIMSRTRDPDRKTYAIGATVAGAVAILAYQYQDRMGGVYPAVLFGLLCIQNVQLLQNRESNW
jgi:Zn-dependent protease